ncbi:MAG: acetyl-CoA carboxylase biotin carboxyl carrier protein [Thermodesulfobacteriota bacterium]
MNLKEIKDIFKFLKDTDIVEFELEKKDGKVRFKRGNIQQASVDIIQTGLPSPVEGIERKVEKEDNLKTITSPMVGTFYRAASPETDPFTEVGDIINKGQVLCIIEAMKLMNEIESECNGKIVSIVVDNGQPVEYGEPLFLIKPVKGK